MESSELHTIYNIDYNFESARPEAPTEEPARQLWFCERAGEALNKIADNYGRKLTFQCITFGCQMNARDSEKIAGILEKIGFVKAESDADFVIINTCTVRENADDRVFGNLGYLKKRKETNPDLLVALCGCMMQEATNVEKLKASYPFIDLIYGTHNIYKLGELIFELFADKAYNASHPIKKNKKLKIKHTMLIDIWKDSDKIVENLPDDRKFPFKASVNITYGCDNFCSYCIVPYVRGRERSRAPMDIVNEVKKLADDGVIEVMLLGQNVNSYGKGISMPDGSPATFAKLLKLVEEVDGIKRIRFMTPHPKDFSDEVIDVIAASDKICHHIHLPLQSGSTRVLTAMNRRYTKEKYLALADKIKEKIPDVALTTDIIVGFPGETEEDFLDTLDVIKKVKYQAAYMFEYSKRTGTKAASMPDQVRPDVVKDRFKRLMDCVAECSDAGLSDLPGSCVEALAEEIDKDDGNLVTGRLKNNILIHFTVPGSRKPADYIGKLVSVRVTENKGFYLLGEAL